MQLTFSPPTCVFYQQPLISSKSVTLDSWSRDQITAMRNMGNTASNAVWNPDETRHPPPASLSAEDRDSELEKYIRRKYEQGAFRAGAGKLGPAPTSLNRAREQNGRLALGTVTGPGARGITLGSYDVNENRRNPELNDVLVRRPSNTSVERELPALPKETKAATLAPPRSRPVRSSSTSPVKSTVPLISPFAQQQQSSVPLVNLNGGLSSTRPLQLNSQPFGQSPQLAQNVLLGQSQQPLGSANPFGGVSTAQAQQYGQSAFSTAGVGYAGGAQSLAPPPQYGMSTSAPAATPISAFDPLHPHSQQQQQQFMQGQGQSPSQPFATQMYTQRSFQPQQSFQQQQQYTGVSPMGTGMNGMGAMGGMNGMNGMGGMNINMNGMSGMSSPFHNNAQPQFGTSMNGGNSIPVNYAWTNAGMAYQ